MKRKTINRVCGIVPVIFSFAALGLVIFAVATGRQERADEGTLTHLFWLLIMAEVPFVLGFVATADWTRASRVAVALALQTVGLALAFGSVAFFKL